MTQEQLAEWLGRGIRPEPPDVQEIRIPLRFNLPPTQPLAILRPGEGALWFDMARWGLIPVWHRGALADWKAATFNARVETVATAPAFRDSFRARRCVVPIAGYYEWQTTDGSKQPYWIHPAGNDPALLLAGLWTSVRLPDFQGLTCTLLTEAATGAMADLHDRQPVMLDPDGIDPWLGGLGLDDLPRQPEARRRWHAVDRRVGSVRNDDEALIEPIEPLQRRLV
jgi:putative SOS response-associated peptidase YedK